MKALPKKIDLAFWRIDIKYVGEKRMREESDCDPSDHTPDGLWDSENDSIYILRTLSLARKRYIICHELIHAMVDCRDGLARNADLP